MCFEVKCGSLCHRLSRLALRCLLVSLLSVTLSSTPPVQAARSHGGRAQPSLAAAGDIWTLLSSRWESPGLAAWGTSRALGDRPSQQKEPEAG